MKFSFIKLMICPYCGSDLKVKYVVKQNRTELINGLLNCDCSEFPVLNGILVLNLDSLGDLISELVKDKKIDKAITICLGFDYFKRIELERTSGLIMPFPNQISVIIRHFLSNLAEIVAEKKFGCLYNQYSDKSISFLNLLGNGLFDNYLKHRFSTDSFWSLYPFLPVINKKKMRILDLGCGVGHGSFVLSKYIKPLELCCADKSFNLLSIAKKYFAPEAQFICLDFDRALPFKNGIFSSILMSDALYIVQSRFSFVREIERVLRRNGFSLFLHVHNSLHSNLTPLGFQRKTMTPRAWKNLFETIKLKTNMLTEEKVLENFLFQNTLELQSISTEAELNSSNALIILVTSDTSLSRDYDNVNRIFLSEKKNLVINPIYRIAHERNKIMLSRPSLDVNSAGDYFPTANKYLPRKLTLSKSLIINKVVQNSDIKQIEELIRRFVILNVPENYVT